MKILNYNKYKFLKENNLITEGSEFMQYQFGIEPMGTQGGGGQYAFAQDPSSSYYNYQDSPYTDFYSRQSGIVSNLNNIIKNTVNKSGIFNRDFDAFSEDIELYKNLKILRIYQNTNIKLDIFISFVFDNNEYFGVFKNFNGISKPKLDTELYTDPYYQYRFTSEYKIKLSNYFYKKIEKWFIPEKGFYKNLKIDNLVKDNMGNVFKLKKDQIVEILGYNINSDNKPYIILDIKGEKYHITNNDYYYFKWRFEKLN